MMLIDIFGRNLININFWFWKPQVSSIMKHFNFEWQFYHEKVFHLWILVYQTKLISLVVNTSPMFFVKYDWFMLKIASTFAGSVFGHPVFSTQKMASCNFWFYLYIFVEFFSHCFIHVSSQPFDKTITSHFCNEQDTNRNDEYFTYLDRSGVTPRGPMGI